MARYNQGESQYVSFPDPRSPETFREAPFYTMARYSQGDSQYVSFPDPRPPLTFREAPFYDNDVYYVYRRDFRDQHPVDPGYGSHFIPNNEQIFLRHEDPWWWRNYEFPRPHGGYGYPPVYIVEHQYPREAVVECTVMLHAPQLCCDNCEHRVVEALKDFPGVRNVVADQWEKKVVVVGENLQPEQVLRRLQRVPHMDRSVLWQDS